LEDLKVSRNKGRNLKDLVCRLIPILLLGALLILILPACQGQTGPAAPGLKTSESAFDKVKKEITVFAGSASKPPLDEAALLFEKQTGIKVYLTYGGSGTVLSQMKLSRTGDIYIPGSPDFLAKAEKEKLTEPDSTKIIAYLIPAINVQHGNPRNIQTLDDLAKPGISVGIGNPASVCVGLYAVEILESQRLKADIYKNIVTQAASCENTAALVALKSVDAVMGWSVFSSWNPENIDTIYLRPDQVPRLAYIPAAVSAFTKDKETAASFISFLISPTAQGIFQKWGYMVTESEARKMAPEASIGGEYQLPDSYKALFK
jgi:molybdate transport system substrate-binding protein